MSGINKLIVTMICFSVSASAFAGPSFSVQQPAKAKSSKLTIVSVRSISPESVVTNLKAQIERRMIDEKLPNPSYFMIPFSSEGDGNNAAYSHTYAAYVRATKNGKKVDQNWKSISWLPASFEAEETICVFKNLFVAAYWELTGGTRCPSVRGTNYSEIDQTLGWAMHPGRSIGVWGPYRIDEHFYNVALSRISQLNARKVQYLADDRGTRDEQAELNLPITAVNCMHAVGDMPGYALSPKSSLKGWGNNGTRKTLRHLQDIGVGFLELVNETADMRLYQITK